jgi:cation diffusion facilitator family transporter
VSEQGGTRRVVLFALAGNIAVAALKFVASALSGSTALLTEAIHSLVDTTDQGLMLIGLARAKRPPDESHPFGYGMETYFWGFIVALMVFFASGCVAVGEGVERLLNPGDVTRPWLNLGVIAASAVFEVLSFRPGYKEYRRMVRGRDVPLWKFVVLSKDPNLFATLLEDVGAMIGLGIAALGVIGSAWLGLDWADGVASVAIGVLLVLTAVFMANETRSLIAGEAAAPAIVEGARAAVRQAGVAGELKALRTLHLGPDKILAALSWTFPQGLPREAAAEGLETLVAALRGSDPRITEVLLTPAETGSDGAAQSHAAEPEAHAST